MLRGELLIFVGAGVSAAGGAAPSGAQLAERLARELDPHEQEGCSTLGDIAGRLEAKIGRYELIQLVKQTVGSEQPPTTALHSALSRLPVKTFVTTNYDLYMEQALADTGISFQRLCSPTDISHISSEKTVLLKLHGSLDVEEALAPLIVTTHDFYEHFVAGGSIAQDLLRAWLLSKTCVFIGFGLRDPNFLHLFYYVQSLVANSNMSFYDRMFAIQREPNRLDAQLWSRRGIVVIDCDAAEFVGGLSDLLVAQHFEIDSNERRMTLRPECPLGRVPLDLIGSIPERFGNHHRFIVLPLNVRERFPEAPDGTWLRLINDHRSEYVQVVYDSRVAYGAAVPRQLRTQLGIAWEAQELRLPAEVRIARNSAWDQFVVGADAYIGRPSMDDVDEYYAASSDPEILPLLQMRPYEFDRLSLKRDDLVEISFSEKSLRCSVRLRMDDSINSIFLSGETLSRLGLSDRDRSRGRRDGDIVVRRVDNER